jgi:hypothetical protein
MKRSDPQILLKAGCSLNEVLTKSSWFTLSESAMLHKPANTLCTKLYQLGEWVELFV